MAYTASQVADAVWTYSTRTLAAGSSTVGNSPSALIADAVWQYVTRTLTSSGAVSGTGSVTSSYPNLPTFGRTVIRYDGAAKLAFDRNRQFVDVITSKTLTAADQGIVQNIKADGVTLTLPATSLILSFVIRNGGVQAGPTPGSLSDGSVGILVATQAADGITGIGMSSAAGKGVANVKLTSRIGDEIAIAATGTAGATAWYVRQAFGNWSRIP